MHYLQARNIACVLALIMAKHLGTNVAIADRCHSVSTEVQGTDVDSGGVIDCCNVPRLVYLLNVLII